MTQEQLEQQNKEFSKPWKIEEAQKHLEAFVVRLLALQKEFRIPEIVVAAVLNTEHGPNCQIGGSGHLDLQIVMAKELLAQLLSRAMTGSSKPCDCPNCAPQRKAEKPC